MDEKQKVLEEYSKKLHDEVKKSDGFSQEVIRLNQANSELEELLRQQHQLVKEEKEKALCLIENLKDSESIQLKLKSEFELEKKLMKSNIKQDLDDLSQKLKDAQSNLLTKEKQ